MRLLTGADFWALHDEPAIGLRRLVTSDGPAGVRGERWDEREPSANVPSPTLLAATWDEARIERLGRLLAAEARRKGVDVLLAPTVNLHRTPYGGRHFESFSEDPLLTGRIGAAYVRGLQAEGVAATVKHFVANDSETERFTLDARVDERTLRELYLAPFEAIVREAGAWTVMAAYNGVNGPTMTESPLLQEILHDEWGWDGLVMSDWTAARSTEAAGNAALDLAMPGPHGPWGDALVEAVRDGRVREAAIDAKVAAAAAARRPGRRARGRRAAAPPATPWSDEAIAAELRATAAAGFVLARNDGVLPLRAARRIAVLGPSAAVARTLGGGSATVFPPYTVSPLEGLRAAGLEVTHAAGVRAHTRIPAATPELLPGGVEVRFLDAGDRELGAEHRAWRGLHVARLAAAGHRGDRAARHAARRRRRASTSSASTGVGRHRLSLDGEELFDARVELSPGADLGEAVLRPPQYGVPVHLDGEPRARPALRARAGRPRWPPSTSTSSRRSATRTPSSSAPSRSPREADVAVVVVGTNEEVECEGFDRDSLALPGRQDELVARVAGRQPAHRRGRQRGRAGAAAVGRRRRRDPARLVPRPGVRQRARRRPAGAVEPGGRLPTTWPRPRRACPRPSRGTASSATTRACSSATAPTSATAASRCSRSATASATRAGSTWPSSRPTAT